MLPTVGPWPIAPTPAEATHYGYVVPASHLHSGHGARVPRRRAALRAGRGHPARDAGSRIRPPDCHRAAAGGIAPYLGDHGPAYVVSLGEIEIAPTLHLEPDLLVFPSTFRPGTKWTDISGWWLAVEVLSPSSKHYDRDYKLEAYLHLGVVVLG